MVAELPSDSSGRILDQRSRHAIHDVVITLFPSEDGYWKARMRQVAKDDDLQWIIAFT